VSEFYEVATDHHHYEAEVVPSGYGSRILVDGVEMPEVKSFRIEATVESASLEIEVLALAKVKGVVEKVRVNGSAYVLTDAEGHPVGVYLDEGEAHTRLSSSLRNGIDLNYFVVPIEVTL
jgi:hypothetical protein